MSTEIQDWTEEEAYEEYMRDSGIPNWIAVREPKFPICVWVEDSREYEERPDSENDYVLKKHFLTIEEDNDLSISFLSIIYYVSIEPEGEENEPYEKVEDLDRLGYCWPVLSEKHAYDMIPDFIKLMRFNKTT
jgi:hypothetical protein